MFGRRKKTNDFLEFLNRKYGTKDSDNDGLTDEVERIIGTNPYKADSDFDGMSDKEEILRGRNPLGPGKLKDFFTPHAGNDYRPLALHPQRLFFYSLSAVLIKFLVVVFVLGFPIMAWLSPDVLYEQGRKIIALTNDLRQQLGVTVLAESPILDQAAYDKVQDMLLNQYFAHTGPDSRSLVDWLKTAGYNYLVAGENLAMGYSSPEEMTAAWEKSPTHYANLIDPDFSEIGVGLVSGSYNNLETILAAQFFGRPKTALAAAPQIVLPPLITKVETVVLPAALTEEVLAAKQEMPPVLPEDLTPPIIINQEVSLTVEQLTDQKISLVRMKVKLSPDTASATLNAAGHLIELAPEGDFWVGQAAIAEDALGKTITLANLQVVDQSGNTATYDVNWQNIQPSRTAWLDRYMFLRAYATNSVKTLFDFSSLLYKIILALAILALCLNIFIEIKKQRPGTIISTLGFIVLLMFLIII